MGEVYRAADTRKNHREVALKRLPAGLAVDADFQRRFLREAEIAARLRDPHVIPIHDYGEIDGQPYLDMRLVDGVDLATHLRSERILTPWRAVEVVEQVAAALDEAHHEGLVHRDVKPQNIVLDLPERAQGTGPVFVYLIDFGIAANMLTSRRSSALVSGTAAYMAPERFTAGGDHRVDVYALGCVLYELLTGTVPFSGDFMQLMWVHVHDAPPRPSGVAPDVPRGLDDVVTTALAKDPDARFPSAGALAGAARAALPTTPPSSAARAAPLVRVTPSPAGPVGTPPDPQTAAPAGGGRATTGIALAVVLVVVLGALVALGMAGSTSSARRPTTGGTPRPAPTSTPPQLLAKIALPGPSDLGEIALSPDGRRAWVTSGIVAAPNLFEIDTTTGTVLRAIGLTGEADGVAVSPDGGRVYVAERPGRLDVIDAAAGTVSASVATDSDAVSVAVTPDGRQVYVASSHIGYSDPPQTVSVVDTDSDAVTATIPVPLSGDLAVTPDGRRVYVTNGSSGDNETAVIIDTARSAVSRTLRVPGAGGLAFTPDGRRAYGLDRVTGVIQVLDTTTDRARRVAGASDPDSVVVTTDGRRAVVIDGGGLTVINTATDEVVARIEGLDDPFDVAVVPDGTRAYVTTANSVSVLPLTS